MASLRNLLINPQRVISGESQHTWEKMVISISGGEPTADGDVLIVVLTTDYGTVPVGVFLSLNSAELSLRFGVLAECQLVGVVAA